MPLVQEKIVIDYGFRQLYLPLDCDEEPRVNILVSPNALTTTGKVLVLLQGSGDIRAGMWSRQLVLNNSIREGSMIPYIERARNEGYEVVICNPNLNEGKFEESDDPDDEPALFPIPENDSPRNHLMYVWNHVLMKAPCSEVYIMAHSFGGQTSFHLIAEARPDDFQRLKRIAFSDSTHQLHMFRNKLNQQKRDWIARNTLNFVVSALPVGQRLHFTLVEGCCVVSAGTLHHQSTTNCAIDTAFRFFSGEFVPESQDMDGDGEGL
eukprot:gnl/Spiro4/2771_TR1348_c0_g1_i1.p2 gnl/Spiro4/2771_TR1348_c0_g1~~gnl/Spiro4/2771_TR1348_c0_g1_i1.p2  ORF type:complete len:265 (-),score=50.94 gnl/Spiro4/2771_TR1348_c0_g1_i1:232-1026(-)